MEEHQAKYLKLAKELGVTLTEDSLRFFGLKDIQELRQKLLEDRHLNNIPIKHFDMMTLSLKIYNPKARILSLAAGVCLYKALLRKLAEEVDHGNE